MHVTGRAKPANMVDQQESVSSSLSVIDEIQSLLVHARDIIVQIIHGVSNLQSTGSSSRNILPITPLQSEQQRVPNVSGYININNLHNRALEEHRRLFGFSGQSVGSSWSQTSGKRIRGKGVMNRKVQSNPKLLLAHTFVFLTKKGRYSCHRLMKGSN